MAEQTKDEEDQIRFQSIQEFLFKTPPYTVLKLDVKNWAAALKLWQTMFKVDGYCVDCARETTFTKTTKHAHDSSSLSVAHNGYHWLKLECARISDHEAIFVILKDGEKIQKVGQFPSLADLELSDLVSYRRVLSKDDRSELHKAIGLSAHNVGVASFVYLRRVLERLIQRTFVDHKNEHSWADDALDGLRITERITFLKVHLPDFLVDNKRIYALLSQGIHELSEQECLAMFVPIKAAIMEILEDEKRLKEKADRRKQIQADLDRLKPGKNSAGGEVPT